MAKRGLEIKRPLVFFDLETTGTDTETDRVVELAAVKMLPNGERETYVQRFNPTIPIPAEATAVHNITDADVKDCPTFAEKAKEIFSFFELCNYAGYNVIKFDLRMLYEELFRAGIAMPLNGAIVDCCQIFHQREERTLEAAVRFYTGKEHEDAHNALADVEATIAVMYGQLERYEDLSSNPEEIYEQVRDPDAVDLEGKLRWDGPHMVLTFGKEKGKPLQNVDKGYLSWMQGKNVIGPDARHIIANALHGRYPSRRV